MADAVPESEWLRFGGQRVTVLAPDRSYPRQFPISFPSTLDRQFKLLSVRRDCDDRYVDVRRPKRLLPVFGAALANVPQFFGARSHPLPELPGEAVERLLRHAEGLKPMIGERDAHPGIGQRAGRVRGRSHDCAEPPHQLASGFAVVNAEQNRPEDEKRCVGLAGARAWPGEAVPRGTEGSE